MRVAYYLSAILLLVLDVAMAQSDLGFSCPYCDALQYGVFRHGESWTEKDPCVRYICNRGIALEEYVDCPKNVTCGDRKKVLIPGQCCPQCAREPITINWSPWSEWGSCSEECGNGTRFRTRFCNNTFEESMDVTINCTGHTLDEESCNSHPCPINGNWSEWSPFGTCNQSCGGGIQFRFRTCDNPKPQHGGYDCEGDELDSRPCNTHHCPIDGSLTNWTDWSSCSATCGNGNQYRTRDCIPPQHGGKDCQGLLYANRSCNERPCPVDGVWREWQEWSDCSLSCGNGSRTRHRECNPPMYGGNDCEGPSNESESCNEHPCPVDGVWTEWSEWDDCSKSCGAGIQNRNRTCIPPKFGGIDCVGNDTETALCNTHPCPIDGVWTDWDEWSECSKSCGNGTRSRNRTCIPPKHDGNDCIGSDTDVEVCNSHHCPIDGRWKEWSEWNDCSKSCGNGTHTRTRECIPPKFEGVNCTGNYSDIGACNTHHCPIDGVWLDWSDWSECSVTCGGGVRVRSRNCTPPLYNGKWCEGESTENQTCNRRRCPVDGRLTEWSEWSACNASCAGGTRFRRRECIPPKRGGKPCESDKFIDYEECNTQNCPVDGVWSRWSEWTVCSVTCGGGVRSRTRDCTPPLYGGKWCEGPNVTHDGCNPDACIDACRPNPCYRGVACLNELDSMHLHTCGPCPVGLSGNGTYCEPVNECELANPCADGVECKDLNFGWKCGRCPDGYEGPRSKGNDLAAAITNKQICADINECEVKRRPCHRHAECSNTNGSYLCECKQYYKGDGFKTCIVDNACQLGSKFHHCGSNDWCVSRGNGDYVCECPIGFEGDGIICLPDGDLDGVIDKEDNCPETPNSGQENADKDTYGDACDDDADNDGVVDGIDNCKFVKNLEQKDEDNDGVGNDCDNCPSVPNPEQEDNDNDGAGDFCDNDLDSDALARTGDNCPFAYNPDQKDSDNRYGAGDGIGDACDNCILIRNSDQRDSDEDDVGDACDTDIDEDKDGIQDGRPDGGETSFDNCRSLANAGQLDTDEDGRGDACDNDDDNDKIKDKDDNCPKVHNPLQEDEDDDGTGDACESDCDADGVADAKDACPCNKQIRKSNFNNFKTIPLSNNEAAKFELHAQWKVTDNGSEITQAVDNQPALLIGQDKLMDLNFNGTFFVNDEEDDDYAGFVFNYQSNRRFIVVAWKKQNQTYSERRPFVSRAMSGIQIKVVNSRSGPGTMLRNALWKTGNTRNEVRTIWRDPNFVGWEYKRAYRWNLKYRADNGCMRLKFFAGSTQIIDSGCVCDTTFTGGKLGVFAFSQANVIWSNIKYSCLTDTKCEPIPPPGRTSKR